MGIWAGIKYALNSTLGTNYFQPLDQQIRNNKILMASNELYATLPTEFSKLGYGHNVSANNPKSELYRTSIKMDNDGSFKIGIDRLAINSSSREYLGFNILKNNETVQEYIKEDMGESNFTSNAINFNRGDVITFVFYLQWAGRDVNDNNTIYEASDIKLLGTFKESVFSYM